MKHLTKLFLVFSFSFFTCKSSTSEPTPTPNPTGPKSPAYLIRGLWLPNVDSQVFDSREGFRKVVSDCVQYGFNRIYVCMWNQGMTHYPSDVMQKTFGIPINPKYAGRDPLKELIEEAKPHNIKVIAWFEYGFAADYNGANAHILTQKPQWAGRSADGKILTKNNFRWMNAFDPEVQDFMLSIIKECVQKYDIDGIQGDDRLPALPAEGGYDDLTKALYKKETGYEPSSNILEPAWLNWRLGKLNAFGEKLYKEVKALKKDCIVSMAPSVFPWSRDNYLQDWPTWVKNGVVDEMCPQLYRYDIASYQAELNKIVNNYVPKEKILLFAPGVLLKVGAYTATNEYLQQMIDANRKAGVQGEVFFHYEGTKIRTDFFKGLY